MDAIDPDGCYCMDGDDLIKLWKIKTRLNDGTTLTYDQRRALSCQLEAVLTSVQEGF